MPDSVTTFGEAIAGRILDLAGLLKYEAAPGLVSAALIAGLVLAFVGYWLRARRLLRTIGDGRGVLGDSRAAFDESRFIEISQTFKQWEDEPRRTPRHRLGEAWREFAETVNRQKGLFNTVRPKEFFDRELLHMEHRFFSQLPALFVSVGLLLTFLGLVAALDQTREILQPTGSGDVSQALRELLQVAGAKFIMSLTGLACSIVFGLVFRTREGRIDEELHGLCADIERGFEYRSADSFLLEKVLDVLEEQGVHLQTFSTELVAQVARPLREEIPEALRSSIQEAMAPSLAKFEEGAGQGLDSLFASVTESMSGGVQNSARAISETMEQVGQTLSDVSSRLDESAASMGGEMDHAVSALAAEITTLKSAMADSTDAARESLQEGAQGMRSTMREVLQEIQKSTRSGADGIDRAAAAMTAAVDELTAHADQASRSAVEAGSRTIEEASQRAAEGLGESSEAVSQAMKGMADEIRQEVGEASSAIQGDLLEPLKGLVAVLGELQGLIRIIRGTRRQLRPLPRRWRRDDHAGERWTGRRKCELDQGRRSGSRRRHRHGRSKPLHGTEGLGHRRGDGSRRAPHHRADRGHSAVYGRSRPERTVRRDRNP